MRKAFFFIVAMSMLFGQSIAQTAPKPSFETLKLNSSPAYVLLGVEPDNIQRPSTPSAFITGLQSSIVDNKIQPNLAFELSPYYMFKPKASKNDKRFDAAHYLLDRPGLFKTIARTTSFSLATSSTDENSFGTLEKGTGLGLGLRFQIFGGRANKRFAAFNYAWVKGDMIEYIKESVNDYQGNFDVDYVLNSLINKYIQDRLPNLQNSTLSKEELKKLSAEIKGYEFQIRSKGGDKAAALKYIGEKSKESDDEIEKNTAALSGGKTPLAKEGFMLEAAAGQAYVFENDAFNAGSHAKSALWLTPSYRWDVSKDGKQISLFDLMIVGRYTFNNQSAGVDVADYIDAGFKGMFTQEKWSVNAEFVYRRASNLPTGFSKKYTYRLVTGVDYKLSDAVTLKFNYGTNFDGNVASYTEAKKMFAIGGINLGLLSFKSSK